MKTLSKIVGGLFLIISFQDWVLAQDNSRPLTDRDKVESKYKWNLQDIYENEDLWNADFKWVEDTITQYQDYKGNLGSSARELLECLNFNDEIGIRFDKLSNYARLSKDVDLGNAQFQEMWDRALSLESKIATASAFIHPEILAIPEDTLRSFVDESDQLKVYRHKLDELFRKKAHILSADLEELLAGASSTSEVFRNAYDLLTGVDIQFPTIKDEFDADIKITASKYYAALSSRSRDYRKRAYEAFFKPYMEHSNTLASLLVGNLKGKTFEAKARRYNSALHASLAHSNIPTSVYDNLVNAVNAHLNPLHRWIRLKKKVLGLTELYIYDLGVPLFTADEKQYSFEEAKGITLECLRPLGETYINTLITAFDKRWIDVYETNGKNSLEYTLPLFGVHSYILLNWQGQIDDLFTLVHELGHAVHSYYSTKNQPYAYAYYSSFVAEVAAMTNESLLANYLIENAKTKAIRIALVDKFLKKIFSSFYYQTQLAEFEKAIYDKMENGETLTSANLCSIYGEINQKYTGIDVISDKEVTYEWATITHLYYFHFYLYQYATSFAAAQQIAARISADGAPFVQRYLDFLKSGSADYPIVLLKEAGVNMQSADPILAVASRMNNLLDQLENLLSE